MVILANKKPFEYKSIFEVNLTLFFTNLFLHAVLLGQVKQGMLMLKYVVYHYDEFTNPWAAYILGLLILTVNVFCNVTNLHQVLQRDQVPTIISGFIGNVIFIQVQQYYFKARSNFPIKKAIVKNPL